MTEDGRKNKQTNKQTKEILVSNLGCTFQRIRKFVIKQHLTFKQSILNGVILCSWNPYYIDQTLVKHCCNTRVPPKAPVGIYVSESPQCHFQRQAPSCLITNPEVTQGIHGDRSGLKWDPYSIYPIITPICTYIYAYIHTYIHI